MESFYYPGHIPGLLVTRLQPEDTAALQALLEKASDYSQLVTGLPPSPSAAFSLLTDCPEGKTPGDKMVIGLSIDGQDLIGVLDVIRDYPVRYDWWLGLLLLDPAVRRQGLGKRVYRAFEHWVSRHGARRILLRVIEQNQPAHRFWRTLGFELVERQPARQFGNVEHGIIVMASTLVR